MAANQIDFSPFFHQFSFVGVDFAVMSIAGAIAVVFVARTGAFRALLMLHDRRATERRFRYRYQRELRNREYRNWKKKNGYR
ncbi:hypothetical protein [Candidatus Methylobacter oryzae]|uniref:Uncharacterized protein n=1 Tax=Candidatus Methylobacter oryzae TaxID=2497749 RepID=A0ABY3CCN6_9GAMM|nr:hypothetical protein [Candidatus Methylobacter oryzae]TRW99934.1 hypothetical protein EKO24_006415 [Candidatus Methylobacter oryzae]